MPALTPVAAAILDHLEPGLAYSTTELRALAPELTLDALRDVLHELWISRDVERFGVDAWRRLERGGGDAPGDGRPDASSLRVGAVKPEDLFDHDSFSGWFK